MTQITRTRSAWIILLIVTLGSFGIRTAAPAADAAGQTVVTAGPAADAAGQTVVTAGPAADAAGRTVVAAAPAVDRPGIHGGDPETIELVHWSLDRFAEAGLDLPPLRIYLHDTNEGCLEMAGRFNLDRSGTRVDVCLSVPRAGVPGTRWVILHELGHVWEHHHVDDETRRGFLDRAGLDDWHTAERWEDRGIEAAANEIARGLLPDAVPEGKEDLYAPQLFGFEYLTGQTSPRISG